jgi:hypothetical protein
MLLGFARGRRRPVVISRDATGAAATVNEDGRYNHAESENRADSAAGWHDN